MSAEASLPPSSGALASPLAGEARRTRTLVQAAHMHGGIGIAPTLGLTARIPGVGSGRGEAPTGGIRMLKRGGFALMLSVLAIGALPAVAFAAEALVNTGSGPSPFPQNKQNEPTVAIDPANPSVLAAGSNDEIDEPPCDGADCPFVQGVGNSGIYFSFNGGTSWVQPTYTGWSDRTGTPGVGPIGTVPHYYEAGLVSDGDPVTAFGPRPDSSGNFSWSNGSRLYSPHPTSKF